MKKSFFAQSDICDALNHKAKHFFTLQEAIDWLKKIGGGSVKRKTKRFGYIEVGTIKELQFIPAPSLKTQHRQIAEEVGISYRDFIEAFPKKRKKQKREILWH